MVHKESFFIVLKVHPCHIYVFYFGFINKKIAHNKFSSHKPHPLNYLIYSLFQICFSLPFNSCSCILHPITMFKIYFQLLTDSIHSIILICLICSQFNIIQRVVLKRSKEARRNKMTKMCLYLPTFSISLPLSL